MTRRDNCVHWWCRWYVNNNWRSYCKGVRAENHEQESEPRWAPSEHSQRRGEACFHQFTILMISCRWQTSGWVGVLEEQKDLQRLNIVNPTYERHLSSLQPMRGLFSLPPLRGTSQVKVPAWEARTSLIRQIRDQTMQQSSEKAGKGPTARENV